MKLVQTTLSIGFCGLYESTAVWLIESFVVLVNFGNCLKCQPNRCAFVVGGVLNFMTLMGANYL